ncbi:hypothetical protein Fcan01_26519 [Folsomia candida]|uniref:Uncharacterized protein n=1 Tax=Folsomia candida TaxID=158441 RepID=A0A226D0E8_FOLCA|nr:hypothetical protein Fcan01_26519 [Folsomia candida]
MIETPIRYKVRHESLSNHPVPLTVFALFTIFLPVSSMYHITRPNLDITTKASITLFGSILPIGISMTVTKNPREIRVYQKIVKAIVILLGLVASLVSPILLILINIIEPERAPFIGSLIQAGSRMEYVLGHTVAIIGQGWIYYWLASGLCMAIFNIFTVSVFSMLVCLVKIRSWTKSTISKFLPAAILSKQLRKYNELRIISSQISASFRAMFLTCLVLLFADANILSTFISISYLRDGNLLNNLGHLFFFLISLETYLATLCLGTLSGKVSKVSIQFLQNLEKRGGAESGHDHFLQAKIRACAPIKIHFGDNFFTILTPLVIIGVCVKWTVKLLLIKTGC